MIDTTMPNFREWATKLVILSDEERVKELQRLFNQGIAYGVRVATDELYEPGYRGAF